MKRFQLILIALTLGFIGTAKDYHVAKTGSDTNRGTLDSPFLTIQAAANLAQPGDVITVYEGIYREWINPPRGGTSDTASIVYQAVKGERVEVRGSEIVSNWEQFSGTVWKAKIPNSLFGDFNPFTDLIKGDWFFDIGRIHHTGEVYLNGKSLWEVVLMERVINPEPFKDSFDPEGSTYTWFCESDKNYTYIYANFQGADPNKELVEINVRKSCFYPDKTGINYITIRGFFMEQAATPWAPPTAEQIGLIGTNWSKGWIVENNVIRNSKCSGITLGKYGDQWDNTSANSAVGYVKTIERALENGWSKENIGSHIVRNNSISECGQTGICGSMGGVFSTIENNDIFNIWTKRQFFGHEMGGIKIHAPIDMIIRNNRLVNCGRGLWLDWMTQGTRVSGNLFYNNTTDDIFIEVSHGPYLIENNILLSDLAIKDASEGGAYVHNLIAGNVMVRGEGRKTPYQMAHSTKIGDITGIKGGDTRYYNNIFIGGVKEDEIVMSGLGIYSKIKEPMYVNGNIYLNGARVYQDEKNQLASDDDPGLRIENEGEDVYLVMDYSNSIDRMKNSPVSTDLLGPCRVMELKYVNPDGSDITIDSDYFGNSRSKRNPTAGPFEKPGAGRIKLKVWPMTD